MSKFVSAVILMTLSLLAIVGNLGYLPNVLPSVPQAKAVSPGNPALLGLWNNTVKSNAYINTNVALNQILVIDVNVTNAGPINTASIGLNWTGTSSPGLQVTKVSWDASNGLTGGIFDCLSLGCVDTRLPGSQESTTFLQENLQDDHLTTTTGTGIIMRIRFQVLATGSYTLHLNVANDPHGGSGSVLSTSGGTVAYQTIDGYFNDQSTPDNYSVSTNQKTVSVLRTITGTNQTLPIATITFTLGTGAAHLTKIVVLGLPTGATAVPTLSSCTPTCTIDLRIQVTGGPTASPTTTQTGNYGIVVAGNATIAGTAFLVKYTTLTLAVRPPKPPTFGMSASATDFIVATNSSVLIGVNTFLTCIACPNENVSFSSNVNFKAGGEYTFNPPSNKGFPFSSVMNVTIPGDSFGPFGVFRFNVTATTTPVWSEVSVKANLTLSINVVSVYSPQLTVCPCTAKNVAYTFPSLVSNPVVVSIPVTNNGAATVSVPVNATAKVVLQSDPKIMFVNTTLNKFETWTSAKAVVYDANGNGKYDTGEPVMFLAAPPNGRGLKYDKNIMFSDLHYSGTWSGKTPGLPTGDPIAYETQVNGTNHGNGLYDIGETLINGTINPGFLIGSASPSLAAGASQTVVFNFNPSPVAGCGGAPPQPASCLPRGRYLIVAYAGNAAQGQSINGCLTAGGQACIIRGLLPFTMRLRGDVSGDGIVDVSDITKVTSRQLNTPATTSCVVRPCWAPEADLNNDLVIDVADLVLVTTNQLGFSQTN